MRDCDYVGHEWQGRSGPEGLQCAVCGVTEAEEEHYARVTAARRRAAEKAAGPKGTLAQEDHRG